MKKKTFAAVIPAAGLSSRMGNFKPLMPFGETTVLQSILHLLKAKKVTEIAVVTGYRAEEMNYALQQEDITILYNSAYRKSHMFDSICMGFDYMKDRAEHVILWPVDIPAVTEETVEKLLCAAEKSEGVVYPVHNGISGHPVIFSEAAYEKILSHDGREGLYGALKKIQAVTEIAVEDPFVLMDMDTKEDYRLLVEKKQAWERETLMGSRVTPFTFTCQVSLQYGEMFFDEKLVYLLNFVDRLGSLKKACEEMGIAYSYGWKLIKNAERRAGFSMLCKNSGGIGGGGSTLTPSCRQLIGSYELFCKQLKTCGQEIFSDCFDWYRR